MLEQSFGARSLRTMRVTTQIVSLFYWLAQPALAQQNDAQRIYELEKKLERSQQLIEQLSERVNRLESELQGKAPASAAPQPAPAARIEAVEKKISEMTESAGKAGVDTGVPLHGFADVGAGKAQKGAGDNRANGFSLGTLSFYLTPQISERVKALAEIAIEHGPESGASGLEVERLQVGYAFSDALTLWLGRFHTPYGYWNTAFHHGAQIQTALLRPKFIDFEDKGGIVPAHTVGLWGNGQAPLGGGKLRYDVYVGNGSRINGDALDPNFVRDDNSNKALGGSIAYGFGGTLAGLRAGIHGLTEEVGAYDTNAVLLNRSRLNVLGGFAVYENFDWEVIAEYYGFANKDLSGSTGSHDSWAGFVQVGHAFNLWTPYLRTEKAALDQTDNYFSSQKQGRSYTRHTIGLRYDVSPQAALKLEVNRTRQPEVIDGDYDQALVQYSIRF